MTKLIGNISICRASDNRVYIKIEDKNSHIQFVDASMSLEDFASAIIGMGMQKLDMEVRGLKNVGKVRVTEKRSIQCPLNTYDKNELKEWLVDNAQEQGWIINTYLGSQNSISRVNNITVLKYSVNKFVEPSNELE